MNTVLLSRSIALRSRSALALFAGKLACLEALLQSVAAAGSDRVVIVSNSTAALDLAGGLCASLQLPTCRIDGATAMESRQNVVNTFNSQHTTVRVRRCCICYAGFPWKAVRPLARGMLHAGSLSRA